MAPKLPIYLFHGENNYESYQKLRLWKKAFIEKHGDTNVDTIEAKELKPAEFKTTIETLPFLAEKRLIIVTNLFSNGKSEIQQKVAEALDKTAECCIILFHEDKKADKRTSLYKKIKKIGQEEEFTNPDPQQLSSWIQAQAKKENLKIDVRTANYLSTHVKLDLWTVANEIKKLKLYCQDKAVTPEIIDNLVPASLSSTVFKLTDQISAKQNSSAIKTLHILIESGEELSRIFYMIVRHFRILIQVKDLIEKNYSPAQITKTLGQHPFVIKKTSQQCRTFNQQQLSRIYQQMLSIDTGFKTGKIRIIQKDDRQYRLAIEKLILQC